MITENQIKSKVWESKQEYSLTKESLKMLWENRIPLIRIKDFATEQECDSLVAQAQVFNFDSYQNVYPKIERIGITVFEYNPISKAAYFQAVEHTTKLRDSIMGVSFNPLERLMEKIRNCTGATVRIASEPLYGSYYAGLIIKIEQGTQLHIDYAPSEQSEWEVGTVPTAIHAIDRAQIQIGDNVVVQGSGPVGLSAAILALLSGAGKVIVIDKFESRLKVAQSFGVDETLTIQSDNPRQHIERVLELTNGHGADVTIEATGVPIAVKEGLAMTRNGGRYVIVGHYTNTGEILINPHLEINLKHIDIRGTWGIDFSHFYRMIELLKRHSNSRKNIAWENLISRSYTLEEINQALADVEHGSVLKAVIQPNS